MGTRKIGVVLLLLGAIFVAYFWLQRPFGNSASEGRGLTSGNTDVSRGSVGAVESTALSARRSSTAPAVAIAQESLRSQLLSSNDWKDMLGKIDASTTASVGDRMFYRAVILETCAHYHEFAAQPQPELGGASRRTLAELKAYVLDLISDGRQKAAMALDFDRRIVNVCRGFANSPISQRDVEKAFADAAAAGDLRAQARMIDRRLADSAAANAGTLPKGYEPYLSPTDKPIGFPDPITPSERDQLVNGLLSEDPVAIRTAGSVLSQGSDKQSFRFGPDKIDLGPRADETWNLVACQFGFECGTQNMQVNAACAQLRQCADDYASYLRDFVLTPTEYAAVQANALAIADAIRRHDISAFQLVPEPGLRRSFVYAPTRIFIH